MHVCVYEASATSCSSPDLVLWMVFDQFSGQYLGNLWPEMEVLYGKIGLNVKNGGTWLLNSNFLFINFPRYMYCGQYEEKWNFTLLWVISRGSGNLKRGLVGVTKVGLSPSKKILFYLLHWNPFKNDEKCILFHLKSFFRSQDI